MHALARLATHSPVGRETGRAGATKAMEVCTRAAEATTKLSLRILTAQTERDEGCICIRELLTKLD